jgi:hypothetical protein|tara:strand:+ start:819 stop:1157 length:339 start_codon:yes stop_codon:yes gene_type:complete
MDIVSAISEYGFPIIAAIGLGYFVFFIWKWVTETIDPVVGETMGTLIKLVDRVRMLDNDLIRLNSKLSMVLEYRAKLNPQRQDELQRLVDEYKHSQEKFDSSGGKEDTDKKV